MRYKIVLVKGADEVLTPFALLQATPDAAFVCREDAYADIVAGRREPPMIGFPLGDVFTVDGEPFAPDPDDLRAAA